MGHIHEQIDFVVNAYIVFENKVLLVLHKKLKTWLPIGGHIELNEDPEEALYKEIAEECGLRVKILAKRPPLKDHGTKALLAPRYLDIHKITSKHRHVALTYFATASSSKVKLAEDEHDNIRWFSSEDLNDANFGIKGDIKYLARQALKAAKS